MTIHFFGFFWLVFFAQLEDGALGMAFGVTSNSILLGFGMSPKQVPKIKKNLENHMQMLKQNPKRVQKYSNHKDIQHTS